jgi:serine/threonine-protein kinase RsbW
MSTRTFDLVLETRPQEISRLVDRLEAFGAAAGLSPDVAFRLMLALDEVVSNVIRHGFEEGATHQVHVRVDVGPTDITAVVEDEGRAFDPRDAPVPDLDASLDARRVGGLGMHLVRSTMDTIDYRRDGTRNILTLRTSVFPRSES